MTSIANTSLWLLFSLMTLGLLALDLFVFTAGHTVVRTREALTWSLVWIVPAFAFNAVVYWQSGPERGLEFLTGYLVEKALAVDNLYIFAVIFLYFGIPAALQHRVLFWGVIGALFFRALFIALGASLLVHFHWIAYVFPVCQVRPSTRRSRADPLPRNEFPIRNPLADLDSRPCAALLVGARARGP